ncbi:efflux RND transporter periplasmic adaptor subunit [Tsuneonella mangrovi]|uniref:efflux RND transporter periplasmic adaptor subunit n=1 Tax=Tsuneonella mangrovi TaxID=1982042 RepID=UPI000BA26A51|nr:efflux RND transporter periplasmic adaptor subunit [Tsuneonella mangrovi]
MHKSFTLIALAAGLALASCGGADERATPIGNATQRPSLVLRQLDVPNWTSVSAEVSTVDQAKALARIQGVLTSLSVTDGDYVKKGQVIGRIVDSQLGYQAGAYGAQAAAAQAQAAQAQAELERSKYLYDNEVYAKARLEQAQAAASAAQAQVNAARQQQKAVGAVAGQGAVLAPATGRVLAADIPAGSPVAPGMVIAIVTSGPVVLRLDIPESLATKIHPGSAVRVTGEDGQVLTGAIAKVYPAVSGGQVRADANVAGIDAKLIGRRLAAEVDSGAQKALVVPADYIATRFGVDYVTVKPKSGEPATVPVQTAPSGEAGKVEILSGVAAGETLLKPLPGDAG